MKKTIYLAVLVAISVFIACEKEEELSECDKLKAERYQDIEVVNFSVNGSDRMFVNYGSKTFPEKQPNELDGYAKHWEFSSPNFTNTYLDLYFNRIGFDEDCTPFHEHRILISTPINQKPFETKTYPLNSPVNSSRSTAVYVDRTAKAFLANDSAGTLTITKYLPDSDLEGSFSIDIDGFKVEGSFDYDLTQNY